LVVVVLAVITSAVFDLGDHGVGTVGSIPDSLPSFSSPTMDGSLVLALLPAALAIMLVGYVQSIAIAQMFTQDKPVSQAANFER
jgi:SulP family sulfate permease